MEVIIFRTLKRSIFVKMANFDRKIENFDSKWHFLRLEQTSKSTAVHFHNNCWPIEN